MPINLFVIPFDVFKPKYVYDDNPHPWTRCGNIRYSVADEAIVMVDSPSAVYLDTLAAQPDVFRIATQANIDIPLTAPQAAAARDWLENREIPGAQFVNQGDTRRQAIRGLIGMFLFSQRMEGVFGEGWKKRYTDQGLTLSSTWADYPQVLQDQLINIRDSFGWTNLGITNSSTTRQILKTISDQFENTPIFIAGVPI